MLFEIKIRVKTPIVANTWDDTRRMFAFPREDEAWFIGLREKHTWHGAFMNAIESLSLKTDPETIRYPSTVLLPSLHLFTRGGSKRFGKKKKDVIRHESITRNTVLTFFIMVRKTDGEKRLDHPDQNELRNIIQFVGDYEGLSPFGGSAGFGLFNVESVCPVGRDPDDSSQPPGEPPFTIDLHDEGDEDRELPTPDGSGEGRAVCP